MLWALSRASFHAFDLGFYAKSDGYIQERTMVLWDLARNPRAYSQDQQEEV